MRKPGKTATARKIMLKNSTLPVDNILAEMRKRGFPDTRRSLIYNVRAMIKKKGKKLSHLGKGKSGRRLSKITIAASKIMLKKPELQPDKVLEKMKKKGVPTTRKKLREVRQWLRGKGKNLPHWRKGMKPAPIRLTERQQKTIPRFKRTIAWAFYKHILPGLGWPIKEQRECMEFLYERIPPLIKNYEKSRGSISNYILEKLKFLVKDFIRQDLRQKMGITDKETRLLIQIIREKSHGLEDNSKIAKKLDCGKKEVQRWWEAYQLFLRIQSRTGRREEV